MKATYGPDFGRQAWYRMEDHLWREMLALDPSTKRLNMHHPVAAPSLSRVQVAVLVSTIWLDHFGTVLAAGAKKQTRFHQTPWSKMPRIIWTNARAAMAKSSLKSSGWPSYLPTVNHRITLPVDRLSVYIVLHEVAHSITTELLTAQNLELVGETVRWVPLIPCPKPHGIEYATIYERLFRVYAGIHIRSQIEQALGRPLLPTLPGLIEEAQRRPLYQYPEAAWHQPAHDHQKEDLTMSKITSNDESVEIAEAAAPATKTKKKRTAKKSRTPKAAAAEKPAKAKKARAAKTAKVEKPAKAKKKKVRMGENVLSREFKGTVHEVEIVDGEGYVYNGETYKSLTAVAKAITGYAAISGPRFFGIVEPK